MWRSIHTWLGLGALALVIVLALSGAALSILPAQERLSAAAAGDRSQSVAALLARIDLKGIEPDRLLRSPSGTITLSYIDANGQEVQATVDQATGALIPRTGNAAPLWTAIRDFHRALFLRDTGRAITGFSALALAIVIISGLVVLARRMGGVLRLFDRLRGGTAPRWHSAVSRIVFVPLLLTSLTGFYMMLSDLGVLTQSRLESLQFPESTQGLPPVAPSSLEALKSVPVSAMRSLQFPYPGDTTDVFTLRTWDGLTLIDQFTGKVLEHVPASLSMRIHDWVYALHTGEGLAALGLILGLSALTVPLLGITGVVIWWARRGHRLRIPDNVAAAQADIVVLVGSEGGTTRGFARALHGELTRAGHKVHTADMNTFGPRFPAARLVIFLTATYGEGSAPKSADRFLAALADLAERPRWTFAVLGFGDRAFPRFCAFAKDVDAELAAQGIERAMNLELINRQSSQAFATWGRHLGAYLGTPLDLRHEVELPPTRTLALTGRRIYGREVQAPIAVLTFAAGEPRGRGPLAWLASFWRPPAFEPMDLLGILPPGSRTPRYYSIASGASDTEVEICVRLQEGGECSSFLHGLEPGGRIEAFVKENPDFRPPPGRKPVIQVGAGTGIAPFVGAIRDNRARRPIWLFWGGRSARSDFLYREDLEAALADHRLTAFSTAFSRDADRAYVQDRVREQSQTLVDLIRGGASVMVCGGDAMAHAVAEEFDRMLEPVGLSTYILRDRKRYLEDIF